MKDFHDLYTMIISPTFSSFHDLKAIIRLVFEHRETKLALPILFAEDEMLRVQNFWNEYLRSLRPEHVSSLPRNIADVISKINEWLQRQYSDSKDIQQVSLKSGTADGHLLLLTE